MSKKKASKKKTVNEKPDLIIKTGTAGSPYYSAVNYDHLTKKMFVFPNAKVDSSSVLANIKQIVDLYDFMIGVKGKEHSKEYNAVERRYVERMSILDAAESLEMTECSYRYALEKAINKMAIKFLDLYNNPLATSIINKPALSKSMDLYRLLLFSVRNKNLLNMFVHEGLYDSTFAGIYDVIYDNDDRKKGFDSKAKQALVSIHKNFIKKIKSGNMQTLVELFNNQDIDGVYELYKLVKSYDSRPHKSIVIE